MLITFIAVMDENRLIAGKDGIPWKMPRDSRHFRETTNGHHLLLGRTTYEQMIGWFDRHIPLVLTHDEAYALKPDEHGRTPGAVVHSVQEAVDLAERAGETELFVGGGGKVYEATLKVANRMLITTIEHKFPTPEGAVYLVEFPAAEWAMHGMRKFPADAENPYPMRIEEYVRGAKRQP